MNLPLATSQKKGGCRGVDSVIRVLSVKYLGMVKVSQNYQFPKMDKLDTEGDRLFVVPVYPILQPFPTNCFK